jgi:hypothetical protein
MSRHPDREQRLEELASELLRLQPPLQAPPDLVARVLEELEQRPALPWWRRSFVHWPWAARVAFACSCALLVGASYDAARWLSAALHTATQAPQVAPWLLTWRALRDLGGALGDLARALSASIPPHWLYGGLALCVVLYLGLFGVTATAYRVLYANPRH